MFCKSFYRCFSMFFTYMFYRFSFIFFYHIFCRFHPWLGLRSCGHKVGAVAARKPFCHCGRKADLKPARRLDVEGKRIDFG